MNIYNHKTEIRKGIYLASKYRYTDHDNCFTKEAENELKKLFWKLYKDNVLTRAKEVIVTDKEKAALKFAFDWSICSPDFEGDLDKGLYVASNQGFGKDVLLKTVVDFYAFFEYQFSEYTYPDFCMKWFENDPYKFNAPIRINDIYDNGKIKREKESIPFLELLDYREQHNNRRSIIVSTNYTPEILQELLESEKANKRLYERIKECFNVLLIKDVDSKRIYNTHTI
jgi:hypothetical protein